MTVQCYSDSALVHASNFARVSNFVAFSPYGKVTHTHTTVVKLLSGLGRVIRSDSHRLPATPVHSAQPFTSRNHTLTYTHTLTQTQDVGLVSTLKYTQIHTHTLETCHNFRENVFVGYFVSSLLASATVTSNRARVHQRLRGGVEIVFPPPLPETGVRLISLPFTAR